MQRILLLSFLFFFSLITSGFTQEDTTKNKFSNYVSLQGYVKNMQVLYIYDIDSPINLNFFHNRLNFRVYPSDEITIGIEARNRIFYGEQVKITPGYGNFFEQDNGLIDLSWVWYNGKSIVGHTILDRIWVNWSRDKWDIRLGRQRINWGINLVWTPNDLFNVFNYTDFDYEERPGTDALRIIRYLGDLSSIDFVIAPASVAEQWIAASLVKFNKWSYDFQCLAGWYQKDLALGIGWSGYIENAGFKGEATYFHPQRNLLDTTGVLSASLAIDYLFRNSLYLHGAVLYASASTTNKLDLLANANDLLFRNPSPKFLMPYKYSLFLQVSYPFTPLFNGSLATMYSPGPHALFMMPSLNLTIKNNWDLGVFGQLFFAQINTDVYANLGNALFLRVKWSF